MTPTLTETRTWTATITVASGAESETVDASPSPWDTLRETAKATLAEAVEYIAAGHGTEAFVTLYKTTKARGTEEDRSGGYAWADVDPDGRPVVMPVRLSPAQLDAISRTVAGIDDLDAIALSPVAGGARPAHVRVRYERSDRTFTAVTLTATGAVYSELPLLDSPPRRAVAVTPRERLADMAVLFRFDQARRARPGDATAARRGRAIDALADALADEGLGEQVREVYSSSDDLTCAELAAAFERVARHRVEGIVANVRGGMGSRAQLDAWRDVAREIDVAIEAPVAS
jgi:hypothetical protein